MFKKLFISFVFVFAYSFTSYANGDKKVNACNPSSYIELVKCIESQSLESEIIKKNIESTSHLESAAAQFLNPDLEVESIRKDSDKSETSASLLFNFSIGGKRSALKAEARAEKEKILAENDLNHGSLRLDFMKNLYRLSQLKDEIQIKEETIHTFNKIIGQFSKRAALSPEQEVSVSIFRMAISDHEITLTQLKNQEQEIQSLLARQSNLSIDQILKNLPNKKLNWPELDTIEKNLAQSPQLRYAEAELLLSKSQKEKAVADSFPDLKIGPIVKNQKDGSISENFVGIGLSMPLPVLSLNGSGRAYQSQKVIAAELTLQNEQKKLIVLKSQLTAKYKSLVTSLKKSPDKKAMNDKHAKIEKLFFSGLVSGPLIIEAHRQIFDLEEKRNQAELEAIETLGKIHIIDNTFDGVIL